MTDTIRLNGETRQLTAATVADLLHSLGIGREQRGVALALNGRLVPRAAWTTQGLAAGDDVEIVRATQGG